METTPAAARLVLPLTRTLRGEIALELQHVLPALALVLTGLVGLGAEGEHQLLWLSILQIVAGGAVVVTAMHAIRGLRRHGHAHAHGPVAWPMVTVALLLAVEGIEKHHPGKVFQPAVGYYVAALLTFLIAFERFRPQRARMLQLDAQGVLLRTLPLRSFRARWSELSAIRPVKGAIVFVCASGRSRRVSLERVGNAPAVTDALPDASALHGILWDDEAAAPVPGPPSPPEVPA